MSPGVITAERFNEEYCCTGRGMHTHTESESRRIMVSMERFAINYSHMDQMVLEVNTSLRRSCLQPLPLGITHNCAGFDL